MKNLYIVYGTLYIAKTPQRVANYEVPDTMI